MKINWNFLRGGGLPERNLLWGKHGYFLELHNDLPWAVCLDISCNSSVCFVVRWERGMGKGLDFRFFF